jgi:hypothetical protein
MSASLHTCAASGILPYNPWLNFGSGGHRSTFQDNQHRHARLERAGNVGIAGFEHAFVRIAVQESREHVWTRAVQRQPSNR